MVSWNSASTCALTIGLNLGWLTDQKNITETSRLDQDLAFYAVAVPWAYFCGRDMHKFGPYRTVAVAVSASVLAGVVAPACPCSAAVCLYAIRALQGLATASLAVSVPIFVTESAGGLYQREYVHLNRSYGYRIRKTAIEGTSQDVHCSMDFVQTLLTKPLNERKSIDSKMFGSTLE